MEPRQLKMEYFYIMGAKVEVSWIIGIGPLVRTEGIAGGVPFKEYSFSLLLINYPLPFSTGKLQPPPFDENPEAKLKEFRRIYNLVSEALDHFNDADKIPTELTCEKVEPQKDKL